MFISTLILGLVLGGTYALIALGLSLQYGTSRIMNLAYGEFIILAAFGAFFMLNGFSQSPIISLLVLAPAGYLVSWIIYTVMMNPLVRRSPDKGKLEADTILATFGLLFIIQGIMLVGFGSDFTSYNYLNSPVELFGVVVALNRIIALGLSVLLAGGLFIAMNYTRWGIAMRAVALSPQNAPLVGINVNKVARQAFALGGALAVTGGALISMFQTFSAAGGVVFTMKALIVVIMGGVGNLMGALIAGFLLGICETFVSSYIDPGLTLAATYLLFMIILLWRPEGLFGSRLS